MEKIDGCPGGIRRDPAGSGRCGNSSDMAHYVHRRFGRRSVVRGPRGPGLLGLLGIRGSARLADFHIE